jgi:predicted RNA-binding protein with PIN domain
MQKLIVDGYNMIHADPELKRTVRHDLQAARRKLVARLTGYLESKNVRLTVVFDGHGGITDVDVEIPGRLQLLYSAAGQSADELIVEILESAANPREYIVVTSDMADIGRAARSMGVAVLSSREFLDRIGSGEAEPGATDGPGEIGDVDYWLGRFRDRKKRDSEG